MKKVTTSLLILLLLIVPGLAKEERESGPPALYRANEVDGPAQSVININNLTVWVRGDGFHDWVVDGSWNGTFPKGTAGAIFSEGIVWAGKVQDGGTVELRSGGSTYKSGNIAGRILTDASGAVTGREDDSDPSVRPYRVRPDFQSVDLSDDAANFFLIPVGNVTDADIEVIYNQYDIDWVNWPWDRGAPYDDRDGNGVYEADPDGDGVYGELEVSEIGDTTYAEDIPGIGGASQTLWTVYNDLDEGQNIGIYGAPSTGLEVQETYWAYALANPLGSTVFKRVRLIYKGTPDTPNDAVVEEMYIAQWSDPDLGQYTDDFAGGDSSLSLGYVYNGSNNDAVWDSWGMAPPAAGYDFLQGPVVASEGDTALFNFKPLPGYRNLPMTTFTFFAAGSPRSDPDLNDYAGTQQWYNLMRGCEPRPEYPTCDPLYDNLGDQTNFELAGDPVLASGDRDGIPTAFNDRRFPPGDRRLVLATGPFTLAKGDTQEVVVALIGAAGENFLQSVAILKFNDNFAQEAYDNVFDLPSGPPAPNVNVVELDQQIVLEWESDEEARINTESSNLKGYKFEGYNVYQLPSATATKEDGVLLATYDLESSPGYIFQDVFDPSAGVAVNKPVQFGINSGLTRYYSVSTDAFTNKPLVNGKTYYFVVTAYNQNMSEDVSTHSLESPVSQSLRAVIPHAPNPQTIYPYSLGDTVVVANKVGINDAIVVPVIMDPDAPAGETFEVRFTVDEVAGTKIWDLLRTDTSPEDTLVGQSSTFDSATEHRFLGKGGFVLELADAPAGIRSVKDGDVSVAGEPYEDSGYYIAGSVTTLAGPAVDESDYEIRFTSGGSWALTGAPLPATYFVNVPFEVWDLGMPDDASDDVQVIAYFNDAAEDGEWNTAGNDQIGGYPVFDKFHIAKVEYQSNPDDVSAPDKAAIFFSNQ